MVSIRWHTEFVFSLAVNTSCCFVSDTFSGIYNFDTTLLQWSKHSYRKSDIPRGKLTSLRGKVLLCGSREGEKSLTYRNLKCNGGHLDLALCQFYLIFKDVIIERLPGAGPGLELHQFDPWLQEWTQLVYDSEASPRSRAEFGFTSADERAYVFGGNFGSGTKRNTCIFLICKLKESFRALQVIQPEC